MQLPADEYQRRGLQFNNTNETALVNQKCRQGKLPPYKHSFMKSYSPQCLKIARKTGKWCSWKVMLADYYEDDSLVKRCPRLASRLGSMDIFLDEYPKPRCTFPSPQSLCHIPLGHLWKSLPRDEDKPHTIFSFYQEIGVWESFRQSQFRKNTAPKWFPVAAQNGPSSVLEFGAGIAPFSYKLLLEYPSIVFKRIVVSDLPAEHLYFGVYRLSQLAEWQKRSELLLTAVEVASGLPSKDFSSLDSAESKVTFDLIICTTVYEHLLFPVEATEYFLERLQPEGFLVEDYMAPLQTNAGEDPNVAAAVKFRPKVMSLFEANLELVFGDKARTSTRVWRKPAIIT